MRNSYELGQERFDALLDLFSTDREGAGAEYEQIRRGLVRYFNFNGCHDPELLADQTIDRVASKVGEFDHTKNVKPVAFFYGFASNVLLEYRRSVGKELSLPENTLHDPPVHVFEDGSEKQGDCLQKCLGNLQTDERALIVKYYSREGRERIELRNRMSELLGCSPAALHTRVFRIRSILRSCIEECIK